MYPQTFSYFCLINCRKTFHYRKYAQKEEMAVIQLICSGFRQKYKNSESVSIWRGKSIPTRNRFTKKCLIAVYGITQSSLVLGSNAQHWCLEPGMPYTVLKHAYCTLLYCVVINSFAFANLPGLSINFQTSELFTPKTGEALSIFQMRGAELNDNPVYPE